MTKEKEKELTDKQKAFLEHLFTDAKGDLATAMKLAGYAEGTSPSYVAKTLRDEIIETAKNIMMVNGPKAVFELVDVMVNPSKAGASNALKAAESILNRLGISEKKDDISVSVPKGGLFILPAKDAPVSSEKEKTETE